MRKLKIGDVVYPTVPLRAYSNRGFLSAGTPVTVLDPNVPTVSRFFEYWHDKRGRTWKHYVTPPSFVLVTFDLDGKQDRAAVYKDQLNLKPVDEIVYKRFPATLFGYVQSRKFYQNISSLDKALNKWHSPFIVKVVKPLTEGEAYIVNDPEEEANIVIPQGTYGMIVDAVPRTQQVFEVYFHKFDHAYYMRKDQLVVVK